jgi:cell division protease FtsH
MGGVGQYLFAVVQALRLMLMQWAFLVIIGAFVVMAIVAVKMLRRMPKTSAVKLRKSADPGVCWDDVAGLDEARAELEELVEFLRDPGRFTKLGARVPKGVLLHGPPGTGKTLMAKAVAHESGAAFFSASATGFVEMYAGVGAARVRQLFKAARDNAPAIIFLDELDAVGGHRGGRSEHREHDQTLNQLLVEMDGFASGELVVVIGASNRLDVLDPALLRPGRFDRHVGVNPPDVSGRRAILDVHVRDKPLADGVDLDELARQTVGLAGADLANICNEAAIFAARAGRTAVTAEDFANALERVVAGLEQHRLITHRERTVVAYHEAGHALVAWLLGDSMRPHKVTIVPRGRALGYTLQLPDEDRHLQSQEELEDMLAVVLAGRAAEQVVFGRITNGAANDLHRATDLARMMVFEWGMGEGARSLQVRADNYALSEHTKRRRDLEQQRITEAAYQTAQTLLRDHREHLDRLAADLLERETLDRNRVGELLAGVSVVSDSAREIGVQLPIA